MRKYLLEPHYHYCAFMKGWNMMPLTLSGVGEKVTVKKVGGREETRRFLSNLGFTEGAEVSIISSIEGNLIVNVRGSRVAINQEMARKIMV